MCICDSLPTLDVVIDTATESLDSLVNNYNTAANGKREEEEEGEAFV